ncbi:hypothetical protein FACS1894111_12130 [Clostridia bacterium]|nr:hypothetical protein FACS1894111_12130 [Clostridia bacterium]
MEEGEDNIFVEDDFAFGQLNDKQREMFSYFIPVSGMEQQLIGVLEGAFQKKKNSNTSSTGNLAIKGGRGSGKTMLATNIIKVFQKAAKRSGGRVGKISAEALNTKDLSKLFEQIEGGYLIIEEAGQLSVETARRMSFLMEGNTGGLLVILEDSKAGIKQALNLDKSFGEKFTEEVKIPIFTSDELVVFAQAYAREHECIIDEIGILALHHCIHNIEKLDEAVTLTEVKEIMDRAMEQAKKGGVKQLIRKRKRTRGGFILLMEKDFEN